MSANGTQVELQWDEAWARETDPAELKKLPPDDVALVVKADPFILRAQISPGFRARPEAITEDKLKALLMKLVSGFSQSGVNIDPEPQRLAEGGHPGWFALASHEKPPPGEYQFVQMMVVNANGIPVLTAAFFNEAGKDHARKLREAIARIKVTRP